MDALIAFFNSFMLARIAPGQTASIDINDRNIIFTLPISGGSGGGGTTILLQTDDVDNPIQTVLNLKSGTGITLTPNGSGGVTINAEGSGGGWRGLYSDGTIYNAGDIVYDSTGTWGCNVDGTIGIPPEDSAGEWTFICYPTASMTVCTGGDSSTVTYNGLPPS